MSSLQERMMAQLPIELLKFLKSLTENELDEFNKINPQLIAKVYQAGAVFSIDVGIKLAKEDKEGK